MPIRRLVPTFACLLAGAAACGPLEGLLHRGGGVGSAQGGSADPYRPLPVPLPRAQAGGPAPAALAGLPPAAHVDGAELKGDDGQVVALHGLNWFGFNTDTAGPHGLWDPDSVGGDFARTVHRMKMLGFNAVRLPFSFAEFNKAPRDYHRPCDDVGTQRLAEMTLDPQVHPAADLHAPELPNPPEREPGHCNGYLPGNTVRERYLWAVRFLVHQGFYVLADNHYREDRTAEQDQGAWRQGWADLAGDLHRDQTLVGRVFFDLLNEPGQYGQRWEKNDKAGVQALYLAAMDAVEQVAPEAIFFIEGTAQDGLGCNWGDGYCTDPAQLAQGLSDPRPFFTALAGKPYHNRVVLAPHVYGPAVTFADKHFSGSELNQRLSASFGGLSQAGLPVQQALLKFPIAIGEFGSHFTDPRDVQFMADFAHYLKAEGPGDDKLHAPVRSWFYWCWNADSGDTGGLVQDNWKDIQWQKIRYLEGLGLKPWYRGGAATAAPPQPTGTLPPASASPPATSGSAPTATSPTPAPSPPAAAAPAAPPAPPAQDKPPTTEQMLAGWPHHKPAASSEKAGSTPSPSAPGPGTLSGKETLKSHPIDAPASFSAPISSAPQGGAQRPPSPVGLAQPPAHLAPIKTDPSQKAPHMSPPASPRDGQVHAKVGMTHWERDGKHWFAANLHIINGGAEALQAPYLVRIAGPQFGELGEAWNLADLKLVEGAVCGQVTEAWASLPPLGRGTTNLGFIYTTTDGKLGDWHLEVAGKPVLVNLN